jgi:hypothetical protein
VRSRRSISFLEMTCRAVDDIAVAVAILLGWPARIVAQTGKRAAKSPVGSKAEFDVESFLDFTELFTKRLVFLRSEVIFSQGEQAGNVFYIRAR